MNANEKRDVEQRIDDAHWAGLRAGFMICLVLMAVLKIVSEVVGI